MIISKSNQYIKLYKEIQKKKFRQEYGLFPAEGKRLIEELCHSGLSPHLILYSSDFCDIAYLEKVCPLCDNCFSVEKDIFNKITDTKNSQGIVGAFPLLCPDLNTFACPEKDMVLVLNQLRDPGNLGTIIRTAAAAGIAAIILETGSVDPYNPKVVRSTMGAIATIPVFYDLSIEDIVTYLRSEDFSVYLSDMEGDIPYWDMSLERKLAVVLGNEGNGLSEAWLDLGYEKIYIPQSDKAESLNVAMAGGIIAFDFKRRCLK